ncbi:MAG: hypothetical protein OWU32_10145 [Firmicutes bacterium]|nr:hypothetical protein [Bacillota bacterium]
MLAVLEYYLPAALLFAATAFAIDWRVAKVSGRRFRPWRRVWIALLIGIALSVMLRFA